MEAEESNLINKYLPAYDTSVAHTVLVHADAVTVFRAIRSFDLNRSRIANVLLLLRSLPAILRYPSRRNVNRLGTTLEALLKNGFIILEEIESREIVLGLVGKFWTLSGCIERMDPASFLAFDKLGYAMAAWNFLLEEQSNGSTRLSTETRVACTDARTRRRFRRYWFFVRPFSGLIRTEALRIIKQNAERERPSAAQPVP